MIVPGIVALLLLAPPPRAGERTLARSLDELAQPLIDTGVAVGFVVGAIVDGEVMVRGYGTTGRASPVVSDGPEEVLVDVPDGDTVYEIGSITKVFTGLLLADAVERGLVRLDQPVRELLPDRFRLPTYGPREIRLVHLATHSSGLPRMPDNLSRPYVLYDEARLTRYLASYELPWSPGERSAYSNLGAGLLGHALSLYLGEQLGALIEERITGPLALRDTRILLSDTMRARLAPGHDADGRPASGLWLPPTLQAASALSSTANDLLRFAAANLAPETTPLARALRASHEIRFDHDDECNGIALFWGRQRSGATLEHFGGTLGYRSFLGIHPGRRVAVVVLANTASDRIDDLARGAFALFLGDEVERVPVDVPIPLTREELKRFVGSYDLPAAGRIRISLEEDGLVIRIPGEPSARMYPRSERDFSLRMIDARVSFESDANGEPQTLVLRTDDGVIRARRNLDLD